MTLSSAPGAGLILRVLLLLLLVVPCAFPLLSRPVLSSMSATPVLGACVVKGGVPCPISWHILWNFRVARASASSSGSATLRPVASLVLAVLSAAPVSVAAAVAALSCDFSVEANSAQ